MITSAFWKLYLRQKCPFLGNVNSVERDDLIITLKMARKQLDKLPQNSVLQCRNWDYIWSDNMTDYPRVCSLKSLYCLDIACWPAVSSNPIMQGIPCQEPKALYFKFKSNLANKCLDSPNKYAGLIQLETYKEAESIGAWGRCTVYHWTFSR